MAIFIKILEFMLVDSFISPHPVLQDFIHTYILSTSGNNIVSINGPWPASNETSLIFYMGDSPQHLNANDYHSELNGKNNCLVGLFTQGNGTVEFAGRYHTFIIHFKGNGVSKIFGLPMSEFVNKIFTTEEIFGKHINELHEKLREASSMQQMARLADNFLLGFFGRKTKTDKAHDGITAISRELYNTTNLLSVQQYAFKANMSLRNFERRFTEQVGVSPKLYTKLVRFNEAIMRKYMHPEKNWTSIAYECGYFDQMHLIKDFKQFTTYSPTNYFEQSKIRYIDLSKTD